MQPILCCDRFLFFGQILFEKSFGLELLRVMNEVAYTIEHAVPYSLMCPPDTPDTKKPAEKLLRAHFASFSQVLLRGGSECPGLPGWREGLHRLRWGHQGPHRMSQLTDTIRDCRCCSSWALGPQGGSGPPCRDDLCRVAQSTAKLARCRCVRAHSSYRSP